jgi:hypothetical protein
MPRRWRLVILHVLTRGFCFGYLMSRRRRFGGLLHVDGNYYGVARGRVGKYMYGNGDLEASRLLRLSRIRGFLFRITSGNA